MTKTRWTTTSGATPSPSAGRPDSGAAAAYMGELFTAHGHMVLGLCRLLLRDPVEAEDATQQVFLSAHRALLGGSGPRESPAAWLAAIARNECHARVRARMRSPLPLWELPADLPDPIASAIRTVDLDALREALHALPRRQRRAFLLRELGGLSYRELGAALGVSRPAVESLLFRARRRLRTLLTGANLAAAPLVLREDLSRLIPGFDPTTAGFAGRLAALPPTFKLASAAVGVGLVATGAAELPDPIAGEERSRAAVTRVVPTPKPRLQLVASPRRHVASVAPQQTAGGNDAGREGKSGLLGLQRRADSEEREPEGAERREPDGLEEDEVEREEFEHDVEPADEPEEPEDRSEPEGADDD